MSIIDTIRKDFKTYLNDISELLKKPLPDKIFEIKIQPINSKWKVPKVGDKYGVYYESNNLVLARWLFNLRVKEQEVIIEYLLVREIFRYFFNDNVIDQLKFDRLIEMVIHVLAGAWIGQAGTDKLYTDKKMRNIDQRSAFPDKDGIMGVDWAIVYASAVFYKLPVIELFNKAFTLMKDGTEKNLPMIDIDKNYRSWVSSITPRDAKLGLPQYFDDRHFEIFELLVTGGYKQGSTTQIGKKMDLSHDVIYRSFKYLFNDLRIAWYPVFNFHLLRLYPHFFRVTLTDKKHFKPFLDILHAEPYINDVHNTKDTQIPIITGNFPCPLILHNHYSNQFKKMHDKGIIKDFFFQRIRRKILQCAITRDQLEPNKETYQNLFNNPYSFDHKTFTLLDYSFTIDDLPKFKKAVFDSNVLHFISYYSARYLTKNDFMVHPLPECFKACENNNIDLSDTKSITHFVSQLETRCRKLGLLDYNLSIHKVSIYGKTVFIELPETINSDRVNRLLEKLKISYALIVMEFFDRTLLGFPKLSINHPFIIEVEKQIKQEVLNYLIFQNFINEDFTQFTPLNQLYDYKNQSWKFDQK